MIVYLAPAASHGKQATFSHRRTHAGYLVQYALSGILAVDQKGS